MAQADLHERLATAERRATELYEARNLLLVIDPAEQTRVVELMVNRIDYDGRDGRIVVTFNPTGILSLREAA